MQVRSLIDTLLVTTNGQRRPRSLGWQGIGEVGAAGQDTSIDLPGLATIRYIVGYCKVSYSDLPTGGNVVLRFQGNRVIDLDISTAGITNVVEIPNLISGYFSQSLSVTLAAGGAGIVGKIALALSLVAKE